MQRPDGSLGVAEWISGPDIEGNRIPFGKRQGFSPERTDCVFESALAFWLYGKVAGTSRHLDIGRNMLVNVMDFQRLSANDEYYGLWYTRGREGPIFQDDEAWAVMGSLAGYRYTQLPICMHRGGWWRTPLPRYLPRARQEMRRLRTPRTRGPATAAR